MAREITGVTYVWPGFLAPALHGRGAVTSFKRSPPPIYFVLKLFLSSLGQSPSGRWVATLHCFVALSFLMQFLKNHFKVIFLVVDLLCKCMPMLGKGDLYA